MCLDPDDSAYTEGRGCFTTLRIAAGHPRHADRHLRRLARDARALELPDPDLAQLARGLGELARAAFGSGDGIVRVQLSECGAGKLRALGRARALGPDPERWTAITAPQRHPGTPGGHKLSSRALWAQAGRAARAAGADEALLFDAAGRLVEGARSNPLALDAAGRLCAPPPERGAVAGIALEILCEALPELEFRDLSRDDVFAARGVVAVNAVRGARTLSQLDGRALGAQGDSLAHRLDRLLASRD